MILKLQQGGNALPPLVSYQPVTVTGGATAGASVAAPSNNQETTDLTDKDLLQMLEKLDGLPSDMAVLTQTLQNFYIDQQYSPFPSISNIASRYLQALNQMKIANFNRKEYDDAFSTVDKNGGINEFAVTDRGQLFCMNSKGDFKLFSLEQLKENPDYQPLTNSELLYYRAQSPQLANNNKLLKVVKNGIGIESITKMIQASIGNLGTTTESSDGFARTQASQLINGLQEFMNAQQQSGNYNATIDNLYKGNFLTKNQAMQAQAALNYIYTTLPANAKTLLKTKTQNGTDAEAVQLVQTLINSKLSSTADFSLDLDVPSSDSKNDTKDGLDADLVTLIQASHGGHDTIYQLNNKSGIGMTVQGTAYEQVKDTKGNHIGRTSMENLLNESGLRSIINADNGIYFGDQKVDLDSLLNIAYDGKGLLRVNLPVRSDGSPNFDLLEEYSKAEAEFLLSSQTDEDRLRIFGDTEKYPGLSSLITPTGELDRNKLAPFIVASGMTTDSMVEIDKDKNKFITEVKQSPELVQQLKTSLATGSGKDTIYPEVDTYDGWYSIMDWFGNYDHIFKGNIYIPLNMNKTAAALGGNQTIDINTGQMLEKEYQNRNLNFIKLDPSLLNN